MPSVLSPTAVDAEFRDYPLYGISVRSQIPLTFPGRPAAGLADVTFSLAPSGWFDKLGVEFPIHDSRDWYRHVRRDDGSDCIRWPGLFQFVVSPDGRQVACELLERASRESFETYLLGHVLSYALVKQGYEPLHATVVVVNGRGVAFLGNSGFGKSTLAAAFLQAGHRVLTDDLLLIRNVDGTFCGLPGPPRLKLFPEIVRRFIPASEASARMNPDSSKLIVPLTASQMHEGPAPIYALLVLDSCTEISETRLTPLAGGEVFAQILKSTFNTRMVTTDRLHRQFRAAREWSASMAVRHLEYPRSLEAIDAVRRAIVSEVSAMKLGSS